MEVFNGHLGFFIFLALWDMWHFFMQHYGFMRIYDVKRHKPSRLSGRLDWVAATYHIYGGCFRIISSILLERCHRHGFGLDLVSARIHPRAPADLFVLAVAISVVYVIHLGV